MRIVDYLVMLSRNFQCFFLIIILEIVVKNKQIEIFAF